MSGGGLVRGLWDAFEILEHQILCLAVRTIDDAEPPSGVG
jgi:hypothetical protein